MKIWADLEGNIIECKGDQKKVFGLDGLESINFFNLMAEYNQRYFSQELFSSRGKIFQNLL